MRITITEDEYEGLKHIADFVLIDSTDIELVNVIIDKIILDKNKKVSSKKIKAVAKATNTRVNRAKRKIENALNLMRLENRPISVYLVSKEAGVSYNTANKYSYLIEASF